MEADNLKYNLLDKLISVHDSNLLKRINDLLNSIDLNETTFKITGAQRQMLAKSENDIRDNNVITDDALNDEEDKWLKK